MPTPDQAARTRATLRRIRTAFLTLLRQAPLHQISVKELCAMAGVSRGTFYSHYRDVYDLLARIEDELTDEIAAALSPMVTAATDATPLALNTRIFEILRENSDLCTVTLGPHGDKAFAGRLLRLGRDGFLELYRSQFRAVPPEAVDYCYAFISAGYLGLLRRWLDDGTALPPDRMARLTEGIMLRGIGMFSAPAE